MFIKPRTVKTVIKVAKQAGKVAIKYGPLIPGAIDETTRFVRSAKKTFHELRGSRARSAPPPSRLAGLQLACSDCLKTIVDDIVARDKWCIARLGEVCLRCHRKVDAFGHAVE